MFYRSNIFFPHLLVELTGFVVENIFIGLHRLREESPPVSIEMRRASSCTS
jgi:hypothetical protein